jgi:hypothetical protein
MKEEAIVEVGIDADERLYLRPSNTSFDYIYRAGMEVNWDAEQKRLFSPKPREWTYLQWFNQITAAAAGEHGVRLRLTPATVWSNVPDQLKAMIATSAP